MNKIFDKLTYGAGDGETYEYELTAEGITQYSNVLRSKTFDCTFKFGEDAAAIRNLPVPDWWKCDHDLFGYMFASQFASDEEWAEIQKQHEFHKARRAVQS